MNTHEPENPDNTSVGPEFHGDPGRSDIPVGMTLESIIDLTGELEHLNELVTLHIDNNGGFTCSAAYFITVQPILDMLEVEIRGRYRPGMNKVEMKGIIRDWIDQEISALQ